MYEITSVVEGNRCRIAVKGIVDEKGAETLKKEFTKLNLSQIKELTVDLKEVEHIGSSGIGKLLLFYKHLSANHGTLRVTNLSAPLNDLFLELKLDSLFTISGK